MDHVSPEPVAAMRPPAPNLHAGHELLVVEDDPDIREALAEVLESEGYDVATAANGAEALDALHDMTAPPCVILLDLMMPVMNGWQFLHAKEEDDALSAIPVVVVSATSGRAPQVSAVMPKPIDLDRLLSLVRRYC